MPSIQRPNLLVLLSDQHNPRYLGCAGHPVVRTPNLDRLAREGMRFPHAYCPAPLCGPSRMSFVASRYPTSTGAWSNGHILSSGIPSWAHALGAAGYETALIGRMDFRGSDQRHGFELRPLGEYNARHPGAPLPGGPIDKRYPSEVDAAAREGGDHVGIGRTHRHLFDERVAEAACAFLKERAGGGARPFAAVVGFVQPHPPLYAPRELFEYYRARVEPFEIPPEELAAQPPSIAAHRRRRGFDPPLRPERLRLALAAYCALVEFVDALIGRVLEALDRAGLAENTLVLYTSDHGDMTGAHGMWAKSCYYEQSAGVPFLARLPGAIPAGRACPAFANLVDVGPTLIEFGGAEALPSADGRSLAPWLRGETPPGWLDETFSMFVDKKSGSPSAMVRRGKWKLWKYDDGTPASLFDLEADPGEIRDVAARPEHAGIRDELLRRLMARWDPARAAREHAEQNRNIEVLKAWGEAVKPEHPDTLPAPPPEVEELELL
ncbi:MAG: sulfatase-like hydrolase/transferase [Planctomycetota bacterium]|nr:sulfatase-like hydrolase/transferase [Planctomycetota bacterium]